MNKVTISTAELYEALRMYVGLTDEQAVLIALKLGFSMEAAVETMNKMKTTESYQDQR